MSTLLIGADRQHLPVALNLRMANRHGLIAGATGTGKTITLQILAEGFSRAGVPVFAADIKGDLSGLAEAGKPHPKVTERLEYIGIKDHAFAGSPLAFWDVFGESGHPVRATVADMGPELLAHLLDLNDTQEGVLFVAFQVARARQLELLNLADLRSLLSYLAENASEISQQYGRVAPASISAIQRRLLKLQESGGERFFGEPALDIRDLMQVEPDGRGRINLLDGSGLMLEPTIYGTFLFWLMTELFRSLPEVGDPDRPVLVFFFDEAHLLFRNATRAFLERIEQVVRLIRSKGVGIYFVTQSPGDLPDAVLAQLGNRLQHALRAYTPAERKVVKAAAAAFRENPALDTQQVITELGVGEALVSTLDDEGIPRPVAQTLIVPPRSRIGAANPEQLQNLRRRPALSVKYDTTLDRESAAEKLRKRRAQELSQEPEQEEVVETRPEPRERTRQGPLEAFLMSFVRALGGRAGRSLMRALARIIGGGR